jgi:two-component system sensor histidine kinase KdpD
MRAQARLIVRILASLGIIAAITVFFSRILPINATTAGFFYLVGILAIAAGGGLIESTISSVAAMLCLNFYFLPPVGTFTITDPQNWVALFTFLVTSLTASQLSARAKRRTTEAVERQREMERLYTLSHGLLLSDASRPIAKQIAQQLVQAFEFSAVSLYERSSGSTYRAGAGDIPDDDSKLREAAMNSTVSRNGDLQLIVTPVRLGGKPIGSLALRGRSLSDAALQSLLNLTAIGLERAISQEAMNRAEVARQSEELKSTLLDGIAHEFKTPLTSIKAVTTDLLSAEPGELQPQQRELVSIADEGADRLSKLVTEAIQLARIEGGTFRLNRGIYFPGALLAAASRQMKSLIDGRELLISAPDDLPPVWVDSELIQMVITHLIDNALKYSPLERPITMRASGNQNKVVVCVVDRGSGISPEEQNRIFDKFYRGKNERTLKGTGMGLAIAREIVRAHGEEIWVKSEPDKGSEFCFSLPVAPRSHG